MLDYGRKKEVPRRESSRCAAVGARALPPPAASFAFVESEA